MSVSTKSKSKSPNTSNNTKKSKFSSSIPLPDVIKSNQEGDYLTFTIEKCNVSIINAIRRVILSDIPVVVIDTFAKDSINITKNTTLFNNEILKQRLGCIPVHIKDVETPVDSLQLIIEKKNETNSFEYITTKDFKIKDLKTEKMLPNDLVKQIFPPNPITKSYILFSRLKFKISDDIPGEQLNLTCKFKISTAKESGMYNVVSTCAYKNSVDRAQQIDIWTEKEKELEENGMKKDQVEFERENWFLGEANRIFKKDSFDFSLETIGIFTNMEIIHKACDILINRLDELKKQQEGTNDKYEIIDFPVAMKNSFDIKLFNEDYTVGKVIEYILHNEYYRNQGLLDYVGFSKRHPHDEDSFIRVAFSEKNAEALTNRTNLIEIFKSCCDIGIRIFEEVKTFF